MIRSLFAASEPTHCLRTGERIIGVVKAGGAMSEYIIERPSATRREMLRYLDVIIASGMFPPATRAMRRPKQRVGGARHSGRMSKRRRR